MDNGYTNDPAVRVNQNLIADNKLMLRYGKNGNNNALLAVNIANRDDPNGLALKKVQFTLPSEISPAKIEVVGENREITAQGTTFEDSFEKFQVHLYRFTFKNGLGRPTGLRISQ
jgi:hypothetical protein